MSKKQNSGNAAFLPMDRDEMRRTGWNGIDVLIVTGDAYVDHPSFGAALLGRWLAHHGFRVGIVAQPRWDTTADVARLGRPRLFAGVTAGALDSMLAHYTAFRKKRSDDAYTPGGRSGARPERATMVYASLLKNAFPGLPVVIGGIEASLRRASHYDFWSDKLRRSILLDSKADLIVYGMAERAVLEIARRLASGSALQGIPGAVFAPRRSGPAFSFPERARVVRLPSHEEILDDPRKLMDATLALERQMHDGASWAIQSSAGRDVIIAPPAPPLSTSELDLLYSLPFTRLAHPSYHDPVPALSMIQFSITSHRGCAGGCTFCSLALHQGRRIASRGADSIIAEARRLAEHGDFKGSITDVGGPSANMWGAACASDPAQCRRASCLHPKICASFQANQAAQLKLLRTVARLHGIKHVRVASGLRHDLALTDDAYAQGLIAGFVGGQLKLAPEHASERVLRLMRKPSFRSFTLFLEKFEACSRESGKEQYIVPYLISAFPGCTGRDMEALARWFASRGWKPRQVQCFIPTPGTVATAMYYAGIDTQGKSIHVPRSDAERRLQHQMLTDLITESAADDRPLAPSPFPRPSPRSRIRRPATAGACRRNAARATARTRSRQ
ncbi:MAG TPA: YgiQ family radical SAM protein [bacterium]|nr:YgiQ family radical SAM protein [bacterium]